MNMIRRLRVASISALLFAAGGLLFATTKVAVAQEAMNYTHDGDLLLGYMFYPDFEGVAEADISSGNVPLVVVVPYVLSRRLPYPGGGRYATLSLLPLVDACFPVYLSDSSGISEYELMRASMISRDWKYVAFVADIYGIGMHNVTDADEQDAMSTMWRSNATRFAERIQTAVNTAAESWGIPFQRVALAGYGLGGTGVLSHAMLGWETVDAVVAFHADGLGTLPPPASVVSPKVLVLSGEETDASTTVMDLEGTLNSVNATWEITRLSGVGGEFTDAQNEGFNDWADYRAWVSAHNFLRDALANNGSSYYKSPYQPGFLEDPSPPESVNVKGTLYNDDDGTQLKGYLSQPDDAVFVSPHPAIIILPDWDGVNEYEQLRATKLAALGYAAFAADIYGADLQQNLTMDQRAALSSLYRDNSTLYVQRIRRAIEIVQNFDFVDADNIAVFGYCFGGTGVIQLAFSGNAAAKVVVSFHGGLSTLPNVTTSVVPYTLILSGGDDDAHGNQTELEAALDAANATWEVTRYAGVGHGYTDWSAGAYSFTADSRSWDSMFGVVFEKMAAPEFVASGSDVPSSVPTPAVPTATTAAPAPTSATSMPTPSSGVSEMPSMVPTVESGGGGGGGGSAPTTRDVNGTASTSGGSVASLSVLVAMAAPGILAFALGR